jgi:hypothetical protein
VTAILQRITARFFDQKLIHFDVSATTSHHQDIIDQPMPEQTINEGRERIQGSRNKKQQKNKKNIK